MEVGSPQLSNAEPRILLLLTGIRLLGDSERTANLANHCASFNLAKRVNNLIFTASFPGHLGWVLEAYPAARTNTTLAQEAGSTSHRPSGSL